MMAENRFEERDEEQEGFRQRTSAEAETSRHQAVGDDLVRVTAGSSGETKSTIKSCEN